MYLPICFPETSMHFSDLFKDAIQNFILWEVWITKRQVEYRRRKIRVE